MSASDILAIVAIALAIIAMLLALAAVTMLGAAARRAQSVDVDDAGRRVVEILRGSSLEDDR